MFRSLRLLLALLAMTGAGQCLALSENDPVAAYEAGLAAARGGDYEGALGHFEAARAAGLDTPNLSYNLGVVNYHLRRLDEARSAFLRLTDDPEWRALAHYNLGLVEEALGRPDRATREFENALAAATSADLKALVGAKLERADAATVAPDAAAAAVRRWQGLASLGGGYDDNVVLANDLFVTDVADQSDLLAEFLAAGTRSPSGANARGWLVDVSGYYRAHASLREFDFGALSGGGLWQMPIGAWQLATGLRLEAQFSGGEHFVNIVTYRLQFERRDPETVWRARQDVSWIDGSDPYGYLSGWRSRTLAEGVQHRPWGELRAGLEFELNDRDDLATTDEFYSYSPTRYGVYTGVAVDLSKRLRVDLRGNLGWSRYADDNRYVDQSGVLVDAPRDQNLTQLDVRAEYRATPRWQAWAQYQYLRSDSDIPRYGYSANSYLLGLETFF